MVTSSERALIDALTRGEEGAFQTLFIRYEGRVYGLGLRLLRCPEEARDLSQEVFVAILQNAHRFRGQGSLAGWVLRITRNRAFNRLRHLSRRHPRDSVSLHSLPCEPSHGLATARIPPPDEVLETAELLAFTGRALARLDPNQREVVLLHHLQDMSYGEIAAHLAVPVGTVKSRLARARSALHAMRCRWQGGEDTPLARVA
jgi:RNA polymerase sigma factor (sigma-70 family)